MAVAGFFWIFLEIHHTHIEANTCTILLFKPPCYTNDNILLLAHLSAHKTFLSVWLLFDIFQSCLVRYNVDVLSFNQFIPSRCLNYFLLMRLCIARQIPSNLGVERACVFWYCQVSSFKPCSLTVWKELVYPGS